MQAIRTGSVTRGDGIDAITYNYAVYPRVIPVDCALSDAGFVRWYGGPGGQCSDIYGFTQGSRTLVVERVYLDV